MYKRILLASDGTRETLVALREGALIPQSFGAGAHLLIIDPETPASRAAEGYYASQSPVHGRELLDLGLSRLGQLGVEASGELVRGDPVQLIATRVREYGIDLVVVGHRPQSFLDRWWSGPSDAYIIDNVPCSVLLARDSISDDAFEQHLKACRPS